MPCGICMIATVQPLIKSPKKSSFLYEHSQESIGNVPRKQDLTDFFEHFSYCVIKTGSNMKQNKLSPVNEKSEKEECYKFMITWRLIVDRIGFFSRNKIKGEGEDRGSMPTTKCH